jgi:hypothetical protein
MWEQSTCRESTSCVHMRALCPYLYMGSLLNVCPPSRLQQIVASKEVEIPKDLPAGTDPAIPGVLRACLARDPAKRPTIDGVCVCVYMCVCLYYCSE